MPLGTLFKFRLILFFLSNYNTDSLANKNSYNIRFAINNKIIPSKVRSERGKRSMLHIAANLYSELARDIVDLPAGSFRAALCSRLWERCSSE